jgi:hypothetical protein
METWGIPRNITAETQRRGETQRKTTNAEKRRGREKLGNSENRRSTEKLGNSENRRSTQNSVTRRTGTSEIFNNQKPRTADPLGVCRIQRIVLWFLCVSPRLCVFAVRFSRGEIFPR